MNKKTYIQPLMEAYEIRMQGMIAASSDPGYGGPGGGSGQAPIMPDFGEDEPLNFNWQQ